MSDQDSNRDKETAALKCWERAVWHVEKADTILDEMIKMYSDGMAVINHHQMMAGVYLAAGGFGADEEAYRELGLPFETIMTDNPDEDYE